jgi:hypothetical protein
MGLRFDNSTRKMFAINSENIVEKEMEKLGLPENTVAEIMGFHGGVHGMIPREVWDWECPPLRRDPKSTPYEVEDVSGVYFCFEDISRFIRKGNWSLSSEYVDFGSGVCEEYFITIEVSEQNIRDLVNKPVEVDFKHATREGHAKIMGYRNGIVELKESRHRKGVRKTSKHRRALNSFKRLEVIVSYKFVEYDKGYDSDSDDTPLSPDIFDGIGEDAFL